MRPREDARNEESRHLDRFFDILSCVMGAGSFLPSNYGMVIMRYDGAVCDRPSDNCLDSFAVTDSGCHGRLSAEAIIIELRVTVTLRNWRLR